MGVARGILHLFLGIRVSGIEVVPGILQLRLGMGILGGSGHWSQPEKNVNIFINGIADQSQRAKVNQKIKGT